MTRKSDGGTSGERPGKDLKAYRAQIDKLDLQILELINKRADLAGQIGKVKSESGGGVFNPAREEEVIQNLLQANRGPLSDVTIRAIYREIISGSRALQRKMKVAFLGPEYSFSHVAALLRFGQDVEFVGLANIAAIFEEVNRRQVDFGVVPLENSTDGRITDTLDTFVRLPQVRICSEVRLRVHHHLLANCEPAEIAHIYSKPQALSQCRHWLSKTLPRAQIHEVASTTAAAQLVLNNPQGNAAIASREAAVRYGLRTLFENIEDSPDNVTRFAVIGTHDADRTGNDCTALMYRIPNKPGSLNTTLNIIAENKINMTWIESFPLKESHGEYVFFVALDGHKDDAKLRRAIASLGDHCEQLTVLGSFPIAPLSE